MDILLDTCAFLWWASGDARINPRMVELLRDPSQALYLSAASAWEIAIKHGSGRLRLPVDPARYVPALRKHYSIEPLPIDERDALHVTKLPSLHRDPFDRMLVAQAILRGMQLATPDPLLASYPAPVIWL